LDVAYDTMIGTISFIVGGAEVSIIYQIYNWYTPLPRGVML
jgi:hypothetical protein